MMTTLKSDAVYTYDAASQFKTVTKGSQTVTLAYDNANRLLTIGHVKTLSTIQVLIYQYDAASNRTTLVGPAIV